MNRKQSRINKPDLVAELASRHGVTQKSVAELVDGFLDLIRDRAEAGATVYLHRFGAFEVKAKAARTVRNPRTGEDVDVPESRRLVFRASKGGA